MTVTFWTFGPPERIPFPIIIIFLVSLVFWEQNAPKTPALEQKIDNCQQNQKHNMITELPKKQPQTTIKG